MFPRVIVVRAVMAGPALEVWQDWANTSRAGAACYWFNRLTDSVA